jgi:hypothetical protein
MTESGYVGAGVQYAGYRTIWRALAADHPI